MSNLDDELKKAAMGDLDNPQVPNSPQTNPPRKSKFGKLPVILSIVIILLAIIIGVIIYCFNNNSESKNSDYNDMDYSESVMDGDTDSKPDTVNIDPFAFINSVVIDPSNNSYWFDLNQKYHETIGGVEIAFSGEDKTFFSPEDSFGLQFTAANGEQLDTLYSCDISNYMEDGTVTVTMEYDKDFFASNGINIESATFNPKTMECHYVDDADKVSDTDFNAMKEYADRDFLSQCPEYTYYGTYFGYNPSGDSVSGDGDMFTMSVSEKAFNVFKFTYVDNGYYECDTLYNLKITDDGRICNLEEVKQQEGNSFPYEGLKDLENTLKKAWPSFYKID